MKLLAPLMPLFRDLERDAEAVLSGWKAQRMPTGHTTPLPLSA